jgi:5-methylcytosine-specific restriction protein A
LDEPLPVSEILAGEEEDGAEGQILTRTHRVRERDVNLVKRKKEQVRKAVGVLKCEVCDFDFSSRYGAHGEGFIECHHTKPVSELKAGDRTKLADLALVCSNCHRMIHRRRPWLSIERLKALLAPL